MSTHELDTTTGASIHEAGRCTSVVDLYSSCVVLNDGNASSLESRDVLRVVGNDEGGGEGEWPQMALTKSKSQVRGDRQLTRDHVKWNRLGTK